MKHTPSIVSIVAAGTLAVACAGGAGSASSLGRSSQSLTALVPMQGCAEVEAFLRQRLVDDMNAYIDGRLANVEAYGPPIGYGGSMDAGAAVPASAPGTSASPPSAGSSGSGSGSSSKSDSASSRASSTSSTNNQVAGVDEADFIKNDDKFLYVVTNGALRIVQAWPASEMKEVSRVPLDGTPRELFLDGDRLLVYSALQAPAGSSSNASPRGYVGPSEGRCTYGYDCVPSGDGTRTNITVFDVSNRAAPTKVRTLELSGSLLSARRVGHAVHTVVVEAPFSVDGLAWEPDLNACSSCRGYGSSSDRALALATMKAAWEALRTKNLSILANTNVLAKLPTAKENGTDTGAACTGYYRPSVVEGRTFTSLYSLDMLQGGAITSATVVSDPGVVYASENSLYMSVPRTRDPKASPALWYPSMESESQASLVHAFQIGATPALTGYSASGVVKGRVLNQFSLDEYAGHLRIATTTSHAPDPNAHSTLTILEPRAGELVQTGIVDKIAPTEDIRSVRFDGSRGFVVTFKKTDPLYVLDLGNPSAPSIAGELKIPGFSTYMHLMDAQHLLTIGYDADDHGDFAYFSGVLLQIFDVSNMAAPKLAHKEVIGTRGSSSEALTNHLAFTYVASKNILALPMSVCEGGSDGKDGTTMTFNGLMVYDVTAQGGFAKRGQVAHPNSGSGYSSSACSQWWTNASSEVKRSVLMDDIVYSISERRVKANRLTSLASDIAEVSLEQ